MPSLYSQTAFAKNTQKVTEDTFNYGTPRVYPLVINRNDEGNWAGYADSGSDFFKVINYLQGRGVEIYGIGEVSGTVFTILTNWGNVPKDANNDQEPNDESDIDLLQDEISNLLSIGVDVYYGKIQGSSISYNC
jgi:hypothetical protein